MSARFRQFVMWLLLLALPVQGWAMVTMQHCASSHAAMGQVERAADERASSVHHHADHHYDQQGRQSVDQRLDSQCSACASCCLGAVLLPVTMVSLNVSTVPTVPGVSVVTPAWHFFTTGPDRPPRIPFV